MQIKKWLRQGEFCQETNTDDLLEAAGRKLDKGYANDLVGDVLFIGEDGKTYVGTVEFVITEANPDYVKTVMENTQ